MDKELELQLVKKYPVLFKEYGLSPRESCMAWGCECGNGWYKILDELFKKLSKYNNVVLTQVKQKFGTLRVYTNGVSNEDWEGVMSIIGSAEEKSGETCEICGEPGRLRGKGWIYTACDKCYSERI